MAKKTVSLCDMHLSEGAEVDGETLTIRINGRIREIDLCSDHRSGLVDPLDEAIRTVGRPVDDKGTRQPRKTDRVPSSTGGEYNCPECGQVFNRVQSMAIHRSRRHGVKGSTPAAVKAREETARKRRAAKREARSRASST